jgi:hypothetical protein
MRLQKDYSTGKKRKFIGHGYRTHSIPGCSEDCYKPRGCPAYAIIGRFYFKETDLENLYLRTYFL